MLKVILARTIWTLWIPTVIAPEVVAPSWRNSLSITPCDSGSFAPDRNYDVLRLDKTQCDLSCDNGCSMGFAVFLNEMTDHQHLLCYLVKFRANFYISSDRKKCGCGLYVQNIDEKNNTIETFENCDKVAPGFSKVINLPNEAIIQDSCQAHCDSIDAYVSKEGNREYTLVYCATRKVANDLDWVTKSLTGECEMKGGHIFCVCGVFRPRQYAPFKCEETQKFRADEPTPEQKYALRGAPNKMDFNWNKKLMKDFRRHNVPLRIIDPSFAYLKMDKTRPVLETNYDKKEKYLTPQPINQKQQRKSASQQQNGNSGSPRRKSGVQNPRSGSPRPRSSSPRPRASSPRPRPGPANPRSGSPNPRSGSANPRSGSPNPRSGSANPRSGSAKPAFNTGHKWWPFNKGKK